MNLRTIRFWAIYNSTRKEIIAEARTKKLLIERWGDMKDSPWCYFVKMKGQYLKKRRQPRGDN